VVVTWIHLLFAFGSLMRRRGADLTSCSPLTLRLGSFDAGVNKESETMRNWRSTAAVAAAIPLLAATACGGDDAATAEGGGDLSGELEGAGATFPTPVFQDWAYEYIASVQPGVRVNYQSIGSGGGIEQFLNETVDFGSSERYLEEEDLDAAADARGCDAIQFPVLFGSVVIAFEDESLDGLVLDAEAVAGIFSRDITNFTDDEIADLNPDMDLPDEDIVPVHRSDGSGTTYVFTHYLTHEVEDWADEFGEGTEIDWASGTVGGQGNEGVTANVQQNAGGVGYINQAYAMENEMAVAHVVNADGDAVAPTLEATTEASEVADIPDNFQFDIDDVGGGGYPIAGTNWIFAYECGYDENTAEMLRDYWTWATQDELADEIALELGYAPMGAELKERVQAEIDRINVEDE
jgi:phosphate transport system substrate-binding protein